MARILILSDDENLIRQVKDTVIPEHEVIIYTDQIFFDNSIDLCIVDIAAFEHHKVQLQEYKQTDQETYTAILLVVDQSDDSLILELGQVFDDIIFNPLKEIELKVHLAMLLQTRRLALQLKQANQLLQTETEYHEQYEQEMARNEARYRLMTEAIPQLVWTATADGNVDYYNPRWYKYTGLSFEESKDSGWQKTIHPDDLEKTAKLWNLSVSGKVLYEVEYRLRRYDGNFRWHLGRAIPLKDFRGRVISWFGTCTDIDDQKRAEDVDRFLTQASKLLSTSLDYKSTLTNLAPNLLPMLGDACFIDVIEKDGNLKRLTAAHSVPAKADLVWELQQYKPGDSSESIIKRAVDSGKTQIIDNITPELINATVTDPEQLQILLELELSAVMVVPLKARDHTFGTISFGKIDTRKNYTLSDRTVAEEVAHRVALAIDNARLYNEAQEAIRSKDESLALLDTLLTTAPVGLAFFDREFRYERINDALASINGIPAAEHLGKKITEVLGEVGQNQIALLQQVMTTGEPIINLEGSGQLLNPNNEISHWLVSYYPVRTPYSEMLGVGAVVVDMTERKRAEEAQSFLIEASTLFSSSLDFEITLDNLTRLIVSMLADWCVIDLVEENGEYNRVSAAHFDPSKNLLMQQLCAYPPDPQIVSTVSTVLQTSKSLLVPNFTEEMRKEASTNAVHLKLMQDIGGTSFIIVPLIARGRTLGAISLVIDNPKRIYDATDLILAEELAWRAALAIDNARLYQEAQRAIEAQKELDQLKDQFLSIASHELRTPLTSIKGFTQMLKRELVKRQESLPDSVVERENRMLDNLINQSNRMGELISEMLDISRLHSGQLELRYNLETDLVALIKRVVLQQQDTTQDHTIYVDSEQPSLLVPVDEARIEQVMNNLISNAIKYSPPETNIEIKISTNGSDEVVVEVKDYGDGIHPDQQAHIFDQFYRVRNTRNDRQQIDGLGLGLYITKEIITRHSGKIWLKSKPGEGSIFYFSLPLEYIPGKILD